jgi:hypothetical protein
MTDRNSNVEQLAGLILRAWWWVKRLLLAYLVFLLAGCLVISASVLLAD